MINFIKKDISTIDHGLIVHGVNCQGVMSSGVAGALRKKYPIIFDKYKVICEKQSSDLLLGTVGFVDIKPRLVIANLFSQEYYGNDGKVYANLLAIKKGFTECMFYAIKNNLELFIPLIGCGLGGLKWQDVEYALKTAVADYDKEFCFTVCDI